MTQSRPTPLQRHYDPSFADAIDLNSYEIDEYLYFSTQHGPPKHDESVADLEVKEGRYNYLWPTSVQRGMRNGTFEHGRLMLRYEHAICHFQNLVRESLAT